MLVTMCPAADARRMLCMCGLPARVFVHSKVKTPPCMCMHHACTVVTVMCAARPCSPRPRERMVHAPPPRCISQAQVVPLLERNIAANALQAACRAEALQWGAVQHHHPQGGRFQLVLASDVLYFTR